MLNKLTNGNTTMLLTGATLALGLGGLVYKSVMDIKRCTDTFNMIHEDLDNGINIKNEFGYEGCSYKNIGFFVSDELLKAYGLFGCGAIAIGRGRIAIVMSSRLYNLENAFGIKMALIYHELGHILNYDLADSKMANKRSFDRNFKTPSKDNPATRAELMADRFVADTLGVDTAIDMLRILEVEFDDFCHQNNSILNKFAKKKMTLEFELRKNALKEYANNDYKDSKFYEDFYNHYYYADPDYCQYFA